MLRCFCIPDIDFYPRPPRGGRLESISIGTHLLIISIHALREEGDQTFLTVYGRTSNFYPRPPRGGRPSRMTWFFRPGSISIHALREEGDSELYYMVLQVAISIPALREEGDTPKNIGSGRPSDFYPRPPRGGRRRNPAPQPRAARFLSPPSARRATGGGRRNA